MRTSLTIREYLCREAESLQRHCLAHIRTVEEWNQARPERLKKYVETLGLSDYMSGPRSAVYSHTVRTENHSDYRVEHLYYESAPGIPVAASLYIPAVAPPPSGHPAICYFCGHSREPRAHYQAHARRFAELGFIVLVPDTIMFGEVLGVHHGLYNKGYWDWTSRGYNPAAIELLNGLRGVDLLVARLDVDSSCIGATGISGGGGMSWWLAALDERIKAMAAVCGTGTNASYIIDRTLDGSCDCLAYPNAHGWDFPDVYALVAPRPVLIAAAVLDDCYAIGAVRDTYAKLAPIFKLLGAESALQLVETPGPHAYHQISRRAIFAFFIEHLMSKKLSPNEVGDIDDRPEVQAPAQSFKVFTDGVPLNARVADIHESFISLANHEVPATANELVSQRQQVVAALRQTTFAAFPAQSVDLDLHLELEFAYGTEEHGQRVQRYSFATEHEVRINLELHWPPDRCSLPVGEVGSSSPASGVLLFLRSPEEQRWTGEGFVAPFLKQSGKTWAYAFLETRGVGEGSWGRDLAWHVRRSLPLLGRTVASLRVYDTLRALTALRSLLAKESLPTYLVAVGEMGAIALHAAMIDGSLSGIILQNPPATQKTGGAPDGTGPAIEMLQCLRYADLAHVAGLLWPNELVFVGETPDTYAWTEAVYGKLGAPGRLLHVQNLGEWEPVGTSRSKAQQ